MKPKNSEAERALRAALHEPEQRLIGCSCGARRVESRDRPFVDEEGTVHRYGRQCYAVAAAQPASDVAVCREQDCTRPAARRGLCWGHLAQLKRGGVTGPLRERATNQRGRLERLERAAYQLADAERDDEYRRAWWRFWDAFRSAARPGKDMSPDRERIG